jgi:homoserine O-acetyltransferase
MKDEYGSMDASGDRYVVENFVLESGQVLEQAELRYQIYGQSNSSDNSKKQKKDVLVVCHALTGNASLHVWWADLLGPGKAFDTDQYTIVCCNILGSCYGSTSPTSTYGNKKKMYGLDFPDVSVQDTVRLQLQLLQQHLKIPSIKAVIGGSFGGMQVLEFAVQAGIATSDNNNGNGESSNHQQQFTDAQGNPYVRSIIPIACGAQHTAWQIAISEVQRQAIYKDSMFAKDPFQATAGLEIARQIGMISYRTPMGYQTKFGREKQLSSTSSTPPSAEYGSQANWMVKNYLEYQGSKFLSRFDPVTYIKLTEQMDSHDVARNRTSTVAEILSQVQIPALVLGIDSDVLYPLSEQEALADMLPNSRLGVIHSADGHDGFLLEQEQVGNYISEFLDQHAAASDAAAEDDDI